MSSGVAVASSALAIDSVEGQRGRPSTAIRLERLKVVGSSPALRARPEAERPFFAASVGLMLAAVFQVTLHFDTFYSKLPEYEEFFAFRTAFYMWLSLGVVKVIHEFGHGLSCKAFKGECHEMGVLLMCLSPALYCNVTDAWTVADKWKRIVISFAGIYVELVIAALATFVWWYTPSMPVVNYTAMCVMVLCSVSTVVFNANPLMRFDGYYMMADWLEIPNLRDRANRYLTGSFMELAFGIEAPPEPYMAPGRKVLFLVYAVVSYVYRWVVTFSVIWFLADFLGPQLKILSRMLAVASLVSMFVWPAYRMIKGVRQRGRLPDMKPKRAYATLAVFAGLVAAFFLVPLPVSKVRETGLVKVDAEHTAAVGLVDPGHLVSLHVAEGQTVRKGDLLARFDSRQLREEMAEAAAKRDEQRAAMDAAATAESGLPAQYKDKMRVEANDARQQMTSFGEQHDLLDRRLKALSELYAPRAGVVMGLPKRDEYGKLFGQYSQQDRPVCQVGDPARLVVQLPADSTAYLLLAEDLAKKDKLEAEVYVSGRTDRVFRGVVRRVPDADAKQVPIALTQRANGPLAVKSAGENGQEITPVAKTYLVEVELTDPDASLVSGAQVAVKVHCRWRTGAWWVGRKLAEALDIGLY